MIQTARVAGRMSLLVVLLALSAAAQDAVPTVVQVGAGSYLSAPPKGVKTPAGEAFVTEDFRGPIPTNDWCSSLYWDKFSRPHYAHPLAMQAKAAGLTLFYPGKNIAGTKDAIFGFLPENSAGDLTIGHSAVPAFDEKRVAQASDWFVDVRWEKGSAKLTLSYGHGSPFVYGWYEGGDAKLTFNETPKVWKGDASAATLAVSIGPKDYAFFAPAGSTWTGLGTKEWTCRLGGRSTRKLLTVAILPEGNVEALDLFAKYARFPVVDTRTLRSVDAKTRNVTTKFVFSTIDPDTEKPADETLTALYPHQWRTSDARLTKYSYPSVRGPMKLAAIGQVDDGMFITQARFPGVLPALPKVPGGADPSRMAEFLRKDLATSQGGPADTYGGGKHLGKIACLIPIAEQYGADRERIELTNLLKKDLESWLVATDVAGKAKSTRVFAYDKKWTTLTGFPASFGSDVELNDHHFHYGYFLRAAGEIVRRDPSWGSDDKWGGMIKLLTSDIASIDRKDRLFPFLRNFDPYAGHSWASGHARFGDGNNNESSSEAMNAWYGMILFGAFTKNDAMRDLGIWLYTTEMAAIEDYWFGVHGDTFPSGYTPSVVTMVWGGKGANATWFSAAPEAIHGINFLPITGGSLYLGRFPQYVDKNWQAMLAEKKGAPLKQWEDVLLMYRALSDPTDALSRFDAAVANGLKAEEGNSLANTYHWIATMKALGTVDRTAVATNPLSAVFVNKGDRTRVNYEPIRGWLVERLQEGAKPIPSH